MPAILNFYGGGGSGPSAPTTVTFTMGPGVVANDVVAQGAADTAVRANANALATKAIGVVTAVNSPGAGLCQVAVAPQEVTGFVGLTVGATYILAAAAGQIVANTDTGNPNYPNVTPGSNNLYQVVGVAKSATSLVTNVDSDPSLF